MSSLIGTTLATTWMQNLEILHYYVLSTLFSLPGYLDDQISELVKSWMAYLDFKKNSDPIKYYTTIGTCKLPKEECTAVENCTLLKDIANLCTLPNHIS